MKATIYDVAKKAGVSIATVSKVINNKTGNMRDSTKQRVMKAMEELNYHPNVMASALMGKGTKTMGLLVPDISNPFFSEIAKTIEDTAHEKGFSVIMCSTDENEEKEKKNVELLQNKLVDGFIVSSTYSDKSILQDLIRNGVPVVMLTQDDPDMDVSKVFVDDFKGGYEATIHHLQNGHHNIAIISEQLALASVKRTEGYLQALKTYGIQPRQDYIVRTRGKIPNGIKALDYLFQLPEPPTAIFACNDQLAIGVMLGAKERGIRIPDQLSLIGFDDTILATATYPRLTTVAQPIARMGKKVVNLLIEEIQLGYSRKERILYNPELIIRETTGKAPKVETT
ncbi:MAG: LacI family DNA-binding transcriptional regulator [Thermoactinomyces sp.]